MTSEVFEYEIYEPGKTNTELRDHTLKKPTFQLNMFSD